MCKNVALDRPFWIFSQPKPGIQLECFLLVHGVLATPPACPTRYQPVGRVRRLAAPVPLSPRGAHVPQPDSPHPGWPPVAPAPPRRSPFSSSPLLCIFSAWRDAGRGGSRTFTGSEPGTGEADHNFGARRFCNTPGNEHCTTAAVPHVIVDGFAACPSNICAA